MAKRWSEPSRYRLMLATVVCLIAVAAPRSTTWGQPSEEYPNQVLEWNQIFIDTLIETGTANAASQRLGAIVHTSIFDAYNGIDRRYTPLFVMDLAPSGASRRAAVIAAGYKALVQLFPGRAGQLLDRYKASLAALSDDGQDSESRRRGIEWGTQVAERVFAWRDADGFSSSPDPFSGGDAVGQWRPTSNCSAGMTAQSLAFTQMFVLSHNRQLAPPSPRGLLEQTYTSDFAAVKTLGGATAPSRTPDQTALAPFWEGNASVHWNQAANQIARANHLSIRDTNRLLAVLNLAMADTAFTIWRAKRDYGGEPAEVTWRPWTAISLADADGNPDTASDPVWRPLLPTPCHPEYPAGHPAQNGAAATVLLSHFADPQIFTLTTRMRVNQVLVDVARTYTSIAQARVDGNEARVWGGMHYPSTIAASDDVGADIAKYVHANAMKPIRIPGVLQ